MATARKRAQALDEDDLMKLDDEDSWSDADWSRVFADLDRASTRDLTTG